MPKEKSCGAVLYTVIAGTRHYVLVINDNGGNCTIPKGRVEGNETEKETALREIFEETNIHAEFVDGFRKQITIMSGTKDVVFLTVSCRSITDNATKRVKLLRLERTVRIENRYS